VGPPGKDRHGPHWTGSLGGCNRVAFLRGKPNPGRKFLHFRTYSAVATGTILVGGFFVGFFLFLVWWGGVLWVFLGFGGGFVVVWFLCCFLRGFVVGGWVFDLGEVWGWFWGGFCVLLGFGGWFCFFWVLLCCEGGGAWGF